MRTTVGPLPSEIYWRRRLALIGILVVAFVGVRACASTDSSRAGDSRTGAQPSHPPTPSASPDGTAAHPFRPVIGSPKPTVTPSATLAARPAGSAHPVTGPCTDAELRVAVAAGTRDYPVGATPKLIMTVRNVSARSCARDLGPSARELIVTSGSAHTWSSDDCHPATGSSLVMLKPGAAATFTETWDGRRAQPSCRGSEPPATTGTYRVQARLGTLRSDTWLFRLI